MSKSLISKVKFPRSAKYVVAVSGGVDSVSLLDLLIKRGGSKSKIAPEPKPYKLIVAHFDHGIRKNSKNDRQFVELLARQYGLPFEYAEGKLGTAATEAEARAARYQFLRQIQDKHRAKGIITAHHLDDRIETLLLNLNRGAWRGGLAPFAANTIRPLVNVAKQELLKYAQSNHLHWVEDATNFEPLNKRNQLRLNELPRLLAEDPDLKNQLSNLITEFDKLNNHVDKEVAKLFKVYAKQWRNRISFKRVDLLSLNHLVSRELLRMSLERLAPGIDLSNHLVKRVEQFAKTAASGKALNITKNFYCRSQKHGVTLELAK